MQSQHNLKQSNNRNLIGAEQNNHYQQQQQPPISKANLETPSSYHLQHQVQTQQKIQKPQIETQDLRKTKPDSNNNNQAIKDLKRYESLTKLNIVH